MTMSNIYRHASYDVYDTAEILPKVASGKGTGSGVRKYIILADYQMFRTVTLIALAQVGIDARAPFFSHR